MRVNAISEQVLLVPTERKKQGMPYRADKSGKNGQRRSYQQLKPGSDDC